MILELCPSKNNEKLVLKYNVKMLVSSQNNARVILRLCDDSTLTQFMKMVCMKLFRKGIRPT